MALDKHREVRGGCRSHTGGRPALLAPRGRGAGRPLPRLRDPSHCVPKPLEIRRVGSGQAPRPACTAWEGPADERRAPCVPCTLVRGARPEEPAQRQVLRPHWPAAWDGAAFTSFLFVTFHLLNVLGQHSTLCYFFQNTKCYNEYFKISTQMPDVKGDVRHSACSDGSGSRGGTGPLGGSRLVTPL